MAKVRIPPEVTSVTVTGDGVLAPDGNGDITIGAVNAGQLGLDSFMPRIQSMVNPTTGTVTVSMCPLVTSITINGNVYVVTNGISAAMAALDANVLCRFPKVTFKLTNG